MPARPVLALLVLLLTLAAIPSARAALRQRECETPSDVAREQAARAKDPPSPYAGMPLPPGDETFMWRTLFEMAPPDQRTRPCTDEACRARWDLMCAAAAFPHQRVANSMGYLTPRDAERAHVMYQDNTLALGVEHPRRIPTYCRLLARLAATVRHPLPYGVPQEPPNDTTLAGDVGELALQLDRPGNHCLARVVAAFPDTKPVQDSAIVQWEKRCLRRLRLCRRVTSRPIGTVTAKEMDLR